MMTLRRILSVLALFIGLALGPEAGGQDFGLSGFDPQLNWKTLQTEHFRIHFHQGLENTAQEAAVIAEESYAILLEEFGQAPPMIDIMLVDAFDFSNGFANPLADSVGIFASQYRLSDNFNVRGDSWWRMVIFHELVHAIELDQTRGISQVLRAIFGKSILPDILKPVPFIEGLAVYEKYKHLGESRLNDSRTRMVIRQLIVDNRLPRLDEIKGFYDRTEWPGLGFLWYNYGSWLMRYIEEEYGDDALRRFDEVNAARPLNLLAVFGFGENLDEVLRETVGVSADELYQGFRAWLRGQFASEIEVLPREGLTQALRVSTLGFSTGQPAWSPDGQWIAYRHSSPARAGLRLITPQGEEDHEILSAGTHPAWSPDSQSLVYAKLDYEGPYYIKSDLYRYDLSTRQEMRLTWGERAYYARFSPDGQRLYYARNSGRDGSTALGVLELRTGKTRLIKEFADNTGIVHSFAISPDGQKLALALWRRGGYQDVYLMATAGGDLTPITQDNAQDADPAWSPDGRYLLYSSDPGGVYNLYAYRLEDGKFFRVTNMFAGAFYPSLSPDGREIAFAGYSSVGYDIYRLPFAPESWKPVEISSEVLPLWSGYPKTSYAIQPYNPLPLLFPKLWLPLPLPGGVGLATAGYDPLFQHLYSVLAGWSFAVSRPLYALSYTHNLFVPVTFVANGDASASCVGLNADVPLSLSLNRQQRLSLGYVQTQREKPSGELSFCSEGSFEPDGISHVQALSGSYSLSQLRQVDLFRDVVQLSVSGELAYLQPRGQWRKTLVLDWREVYRMPLLSSQALTLRLSAGWTDATVKEEKLKLGGPYGRFRLRGFPAEAFVGRQAVSAGVQYSFPLFSIERGVGQWPLFVDDLGMSLFVDAGLGGDQLSLRRLKVGFGVEAQLSLTLGYFQSFGLIAGVAQGLGEAQPVFYLNATLPGLL
jgi:Tol biopolymer transport system component